MSSLPFLHHHNRELGSFLKHPKEICCRVERIVWREGKGKINRANKYEDPFHNPTHLAPKPSFPTTAAIAAQSAFLLSLCQPITPAPATAAAAMTAAAPTRVSASFEVKVDAKAAGAVVLKERPAE